MSKEITYTIIKGLDVQACMKASSGATDAQNKMQKLNGSVWEQTVAPIMEELELAQVKVEASEENIKAIREDLYNRYEQYMYRSGVVIPETGKNRKGETFVIRNAKTKQPQFGSWSETRRIWAYLGDIAKILAHGHGAVLYPEKYKVAARVGVLSLCKNETNALQNVQRLCKDLQGFLDVVSGGDALAAQTEVDGLIVNNVGALEEASGLIRRLDRIFSAVDGTEKTQLSNMILSMAQKHFPA